ncbi:glycine receptor subunit alpha-2-like [Watersipora subatra]|uniref:glycine receptor subunit alpha-2-like n=1 Tax=Watersipora subatra TaxID=2589382 RepID=UPI00355BD9B1
MERLPLAMIWLCLALLGVACKEVPSEDNVVKAVREVYENYDKNVRPPKGGEAISVGVDVYVISLSAISEKDMDFTVNMYIRQRWQDIRLAHPNFTGDNGILITSQIPHTWLPDLFIKNDKESKKSDVTTLNTFLRVDSEGNLAYSMRVTSTIACSMRLERYPFDEQFCNMLFESYGHMLKELRLHWNEDTGQPVEINEQIQLPEHVIKEAITLDCSKTYNTTGSFSCIAIQFEFSRNINYYIMGLFLPSILIVVLSWVAFWIDKSSTPGRVSLSLLTILTMQNQMSSTLAQLPKVSYIKLVDVWLTGCLGFVFAGFLEYALVNKLAIKEKEKQKNYSVTELDQFAAGLRKTFSGIAPVTVDLVSEKQNTENGTRMDNGDGPEDPLTGTHGQAEEQHTKVKKKRMSLADQVDYFSRFVFPLAFLLFNLVLWLKYLVPKSDQEATSFLERGQN